MATLTPTKDCESPMDMNERRKAQNRAAQKKYRTRQKMRLELARAILLGRQHLRLEESAEWALSTENHGLQLTSNNPSAPTHSPSISSTGSMMTTTSNKSTNEGSTHSSIGISESVEVAIEHPESHSMAFDLDLDHDLSLSDFAASPAESPINADCIDPELTHLDWMGDNSIDRGITTLPSPVATPVLDRTKSTHVSDAQSALVSSPWPTLPLDATPPASQPPSTRSSSETPSSSPLFTAIALGNLDMARMLVSAGAKIDIPDSHGNTLLHRSIQRGDVAATCTLLDLGANALKTNAAGIGSLHMAVEAGNAEMTRVILERCARDEDGSARKDGQTGAKNSLRRCIDARDARNMTAVHLSVSLQRMEILKILLEYGADVNIGCE